MIKKTYRATFVSTATAKQFNHARFRTSVTDQGKVDIFSKHSVYYEGIWEECELWVKENWEAWNEERPAWFTERVKASVPKEMIPKSEEDDEEEVKVTDINE